MCPWLLGLVGRPWLRTPPCHPGLLDVSKGIPPSDCRRVSPGRFLMRLDGCFLEICKNDDVIIVDGPLWWENTCWFSRKGPVMRIIDVQCVVSLNKLKSFHPTFNNGCHYLSMHGNKRGLRSQNMLSNSINFVSQNVNILVMMTAKQCQRLRYHNIYYIYHLLQTHHNRSNRYDKYRKTFNIYRTNPKTLFVVSICCCLCAIYWSQVLSGEWRCSWSSAGSAAPTTSELSTI